MSKENFFLTPQRLPSKELTVEQRSRISKNFRAAKALLARKRPYEAIRSPSRNGENGVKSFSGMCGTRRTPLKEIDTNIDPLFSDQPGLTDFASRSESSLGNKIISGPVLPKQFRQQRAESRPTNDQSFPTREYEAVANTKSFSFHGFHEDDFDESILTEIDALCEKQSATKERQTSSNLSLENGSNKVLDNMTLEPLTTTKMLEVEMGNTPAVKQNENLNSSQETHIGCMHEKYMKYMQSLNEEQKEATVSDISFPLMIVAGPGSGKTSTMVGRVLTLLKEGVGPANILAMTFTTAGASEMRQRIESIAGKGIAKELTISTFHSFCLQLCRSHTEKLGRTSDFLIYGHGQQRRAVIEAIRLMENAQKSEQHAGLHKLDEDSCGMVVGARLCKVKSKKWQRFVTQAKAAGKTPEEFQKMGDGISASVLGNYNNILSSCNALDYHDFISSSVMLLTNFPEVVKECQDAWKAIIVDEFQDTSSMQYNLLKILASHNRITIVGDDDQSIFSFNGADSCGFEVFRKDFPMHKEIRLRKNYRSTSCIVEAASSLIQNNEKRFLQKEIITDNPSGSKITIKECHNEEAQCSFVVDKIIEHTSDGLTPKCTFGNISVLYRRQVSGKAFQTSFRSRKIPFNVHGVAFYRKKVIKAIMAMLKTALPHCDDGPFRQVFKALLPLEKDEKKRVIEYIDKICTVRKCSFVSAACDIFGAKISGTFKRSQLTQGRKLLVTLDMISKLVQREESISVVITSVANMLPQKYLLEQRAVVDAEGGKLLNEDSDLRSVLQYLLDDVSDFLSMHVVSSKEDHECGAEGKGCINVLKAFIDYVTARESENFQSRRRDNENSVTLTTIHQSKGLEWDIVFIVKANESEIPLLHEFNGVVEEGGSTLEEERRLLYVAMTRTRKKLYILYVTMDSNWQLLHPSRFLKEIPCHLIDFQSVLTGKDLQGKPKDVLDGSAESVDKASEYKLLPEDKCPNIRLHENDSTCSIELTEASSGNVFLRRFSVDDRSTVSHLFHQWAKKQAFQKPKRLLDKVGFVIDERLRTKTCRNKDVLRAVKACLCSEEAVQYAKYVLQWEQIPADRRAHLVREKQEHFQKQRIENAMNSSAATAKQVAYLKNLGCTIVPTSRLHASRLIEQYKSL